MANAIQLSAPANCRFYANKAAFLSSFTIEEPGSQDSTLTNRWYVLAEPHPELHRIAEHP